MKIQANDIHIWYLQDKEITNSKLLQTYYEVLSDDEIERQRHFYFSKHQHQFLLSRAFIRFVLSMYDSQVKPHEWQFEKNQYGKPTIASPVNALPLHFNLSHTEQMIILAVDLEQEVGVDVESLCRKNTPLEIASKFFSDIEVKTLFQLPINDQKQHFFSLWTLKEAYIKARGMGLSIPLNQFSFLFPKQGGVGISFGPKINDNPKEWSFWQFSLLEEYLIALAIKKQSSMINTTTVTVHHALPVLVK